MQIIRDERDIRLAAESFMRHLKDHCSSHGAGAEGEGEAFVNARFGFWFSARETDGSLRVRFGMGEPRGETLPEPVCDMRLPLGGFEPGGEGFFVRFGGDVLAAFSARPESGGQAFAAHLELHDYGPTIHYVPAPDGSPLKAVILASTSSPDPAFDVFRFVSAMNDFRQWSARGLVPGDGARPGPSWPSGGGEEGGGRSLAETILDGVREQLAKHLHARDTGYAVASPPPGGLVLRNREGSPAAVIQVTDSLAPETLYTAIGKLLLTRGNPRAAKFLVLPGTLGPFFSQALFRHDIQAVQYKLTREMAVVLDTDEIFSAIDAQ
ncbi:MAG: hypothetical protein ACOZEN_12520 [Thermodesulfobacteriota bacterium]